MVLLLAMLAVIIVPSGAQKTPQQVNIDYPFLTRVSEYLATKYEQDNLDKAAQKADQMILLDALAERTTANVVKEREAKLPFAGGIEVPVQTKVAEAGNANVVCKLGGIQMAMNGFGSLTQPPLIVRCLIAR